MTRPSWCCTQLAAQCSLPAMAGGIHYDPAHHQYVLLGDPTVATAPLRHCPWCGTALALTAGPTVRPRHGLAVGAGILNSRGEILLIQTPRGDWEFPGGLVEAGESLLTALHREVDEETGLQIVIEALVGVSSNLQIASLNLDFRCRVRSGTLRPSEESPQLGWFAPMAALAHVDRPAIRGRLAALLAAPGAITYRAYHVLPRSAAIPYAVREEQAIG